MLSYERQSTFSKNSFKFRNNNLKKYSNSRTINHEIVGIPPSRPTLQKKFIKGLKSPMYQCLDCDYVSDRKSNLSRHMEKHTQTREPPRCDSQKIKAKAKQFVSHKSILSISLFVF
ncbi:C2H2-type zinc finger transcription factor [Phycomyces blakesleeanus NRRL 1555(-)]|uniref:C2H2-type zinc finger transcription factor n=1 Tax=Phycomyces blakesleeanus (strain ATCC 8743b / DSM 1359 / FGSC 10004 / NBRC 33097 / NRRL 1555) TaxID=763407 RepID=A0A167P8F0_PHYB8|nr:C2H2-type zinc finger transcription factor [Phycomyces blakesleeanus NRRL 1555(-)]OAD77459.1 C2H2-type zinc finger transcription factor [Phycomyces blakesleeanus NRRL 1555(-)]|eukprot:XP_018295499.1 C2H2-type zinc finger transcription factor [Phycomyces blakesleeanus NRRL 1555(-)]